MVKISIIIPVFNNEQYIRQCIRSVQRQTVADLEMICVDDGSTDASAEILKRLQAEEPRIVLVHQKNQGAAAARNAGIELATGKYLAFLDADDYYLKQDALEKMIDCCERKRVKTCGSVMYLVQGEVSPSPQADLVKAMAQEGIVTYGEYPLDYDFTTFIFARAMIMEKYIRFPEYRYFEDPPFLVRALYEAEHFCMVDVGLYCYRKTEVAFKLTGDKVKDLLSGLIDNLNFAKEHRLERLFEKTLERLEYEYGNHIYHNITNESQEEIALLKSAGKIAGVQMQKADYMVRPLQLLMERGVYSRTRYEAILLEHIYEADSIAVYGAGKLGKRFLRYLKELHQDQKVSCILVSKQSGAQQNIEGIPVMELAAYEKKQGEMIFAALGGIYYHAVEESLKQKQILAYMLVDDVFLEMLEVE